MTQVRHWGRNRHIADLSPKRLGAEFNQSVAGSLKAKTLAGGRGPCCRCFNAEPVARPGDSGGHGGDVCHHDLHVHCARAYLHHKIGTNQVTDHELLCPRCADRARRRAAGRGRSTTSCGARAQRCAGRAAMVGQVQPARHVGVHAVGGGLPSPARPLCRAPLRRAPLRRAPLRLRSAPAPWAGTRATSSPPPPHSRPWHRASHTTTTTTTTTTSASCS